MRKFLIVALSICTFVLIFGDCSFAYETPECDYGTFDAWYSKDGIEWQNTTVDNAKLKCGEPFYVRATISAKINLQYASIEIWEVGENSPEESSFEMLEGIGGFFDSVPFYNLLKGNVSTYVWKMRVKSDAKWAGGTAPLNIRAQFNKNDDEDDEISFSVINAYILDELWEGYTEDNGNSSGNNDTNGTPGFELLFAMVAIAVFLTWKRKKE